MVVLDDEAVAEGHRDRVAQPILERAVVASVRAPARAMACAWPVRLPRPWIAGLVGKDPEDPLLVVGHALQAFLLVLDLAPHDRDQPVLGKQRRADGLHAAVGQRAVAGSIEAAKDSPDRIVHLPQPGGVQDQLALDARRHRGRRTGSRGTPRRNRR